VTKTRAASASSKATTAVWDGQSLLAAFDAATRWLDVNRDRVNALNVFPVPDGDTGSNMALTMRAAVAEGRASGATAAGEMAARVAYGALMGARGNSGVILSQVFRGVAKAIAGRDEVDGRDLAHALTTAREMAYNAVMKPVEGTMLTVVRGAAERAAKVAERTPSLPAVMAEALQGAEEALATTPELLDILRQAGVVDAGGQGIVLLLEAMDASLRGDDLAEHAALSVTEPVGAGMEFLDQIDELHGDDAFGYCTNFVVLGEAIPFDQARAKIGGMGQSAVIVGDETVLKVHVHVENPGPVLDYAARLGALDQIKIDNMQAQTRVLTTERGDHLETTPTIDSSPPNLPAGTQSVLAVAAGDGLAKALRSMGAAGIVGGGQTANPSIEELLAAVEAAPTPRVILLPNNPNIVLTAGRVPELSSKDIRVVPSRSVPQGLAALAVFHPDDDFDANVAAMTAALSSVKTVELTRAVRDVTLDGMRVIAGQVIGLVDDCLVVAGDESGEVACETLDRAGLADAELVTIFTGDDAQPGHAATLRDSILERYPEVHVEVHDGGQPHYRFVIAVE